MKAFSVFGTLNCTLSRILKFLLDDAIVQAKFIRFMLTKNIPEVKHTTSTLALFEKMYVGRPFVPFANWCVRAQISQQNKSSDVYCRPPTKPFLYKSQRFLAAVSMDFSWIETEIDTYDACVLALISGV